MEAAGYHLKAGQDSATPGLDCMFSKSISADAAKYIFPKCCEGWTGDNCDEVAEETYVEDESELALFMEKLDELEAGGGRIQEFDPDRTFATCLAYGEDHYRTFDGRYFTFPGECKYRLAGSVNNMWQVYAMNMYNDTKVHDADTVFKKLNLMFGADTIIAQGYNVEVNGQTINVDTGYANNRISIEKLGDFIYFESNQGVRVKWDDGFSVYVTVEQSDWFDSVDGLCGTYTDLVQDDFTAQGGDIEEYSSVFGNSWRVYDADSTTKCADVSEDNHPCLRDGYGHIRQEAEGVCGMLETGAFSDCNGKVSANPFVLDCLYSYCHDYFNTHERDNAVCEIFSAYSYECAIQDEIVFWRTNNFCAKECEGIMQYTSCGTNTPPMCSTASYTGFSHLGAGGDDHECMPGCQCPDGLYLDDSKPVCNRTCVTKDM
jgi:hypothetical protein